MISIISARIAKGVLICGMTLFACVTSLHAEAITVKAGVRSTLGPILVYGKKTCHISPPTDYSISSQPKHGKATVFTRKVTLPKNYHICPGSTGYVLYVTYQPNGGYRGPDNLSVKYGVERYISTPAEMYIERIVLNVK